MNNTPGINPIFRVDWVVILIYMALLAFGWISICGASPEIGGTEFFSLATRAR